MRINILLFYRLIFVIYKYFLYFCNKKMKFIIQTINDDIEFLNYFNQDNIEYVKDNGQFKISNPTAYCPIGSIIKNNIQ